MIVGVIAFIVYIIVMLGVFWYLAKSAPEGYEDEKGFHYGKKKDKDRWDR